MDSKMKKGIVAFLLAVLEVEWTMGTSFLAEVLLA